MNSGFDMNKDLTAGRGADTILSAAFCQRHIPAALRYRGQLRRGEISRHRCARRDREQL